MRIFTFTFTICWLLLMGTSSLIFGQSAFTMTQIGPNFLLDKPWDLHYGPDDYLWVTEREQGVVVRINPETAERDQLIRISDVYAAAGQDGLLGMALHSNFEESPYVYLSYTYQSNGRRQKIVRYTYSIAGNNGTMYNPVTLIDNLPASNDHNSGRLIFGPDMKLYYTIGDQGSNQGGNYCNTILSQVIPSQAEIDQQDWSNYPGKILRLNLDGSIPDDNPTIQGIRSHIYSYGHRNAQGIAFGTDGILYADEHGPDTDDEVNIIYGGANYGWPYVAGYQDNQAYDYCDWSSASNCQNLNYSKTSCPAGVNFMEESSLIDTNYREPLLSMFAVTDDYDFNNPICGNSWMCRPNVAPSSIGFYGSGAIPDWQNSLLVTSLKRGRIYRLKLDESGTVMVGDTTQHFYTQNRYRDVVVAPDGKSIYVITDSGGKTSDASGLNQRNTVLNPGAILKFTYETAVSVHEVDQRDIFQLWPNPASDIVQISVKPAQQSDIHLSIYNTAGQEMSNPVELLPGTNTVSVADLPAGIYFFRVATQDQAWLQRIVLQ